MKVESTEKNGNRTINIHQIFRLITVIIWFLSLLGCATYFRPQEFGAIADGNYDCTNSIRSMLAAMKEKNVYLAKFPPGEYKISEVIEIDFPCSLKGKNATVITTDTLRSRDAFRFSRGKSVDISPNKKRTELSLNFKIHGVPIAIWNYSNIFVHDCTIRTFTGTDIYWKTTKFWFAINCRGMYDAKFKNICFDQPANYRKNQFNSADGLHLGGDCHDVKVEGCHGHTGDDFIALNANENGAGNISNVIIRNCNIGSDTLSKNGIRIYGMAKERQLTISDVTIENCRIKSLNSPCIYITNSDDGILKKDYQRIKVENLSIKNCTFYCPQYELASNDHPSAIRIAGVDGEGMILKNIKAIANVDSLSYFLNIMGYNDLKGINIHKCSLKGRNAYQFIKIKEGIGLEGFDEKRNKLIN